MGSKGSSTTSFTPPPEVVEAYKEALGYGRAAMGMQYAPYTGEITAPLTPTQESGIYNVNRAVGTAIPYFGQATELTANAAGRTIAPQQFSQEAIQQYQSPYTQAVADATFRNLREQQRQEQAGLQGQAIRAGAFGGDRAGIAAANMARQQDLATALAMSQIYNQGYQQATGLFGQQQGVNLAAQQADAARQMQGAQQLAGLGTGLQGSVLQGAQAQLAAGAQQQAVQQAINSGYYNQYLAAQAYPYQQAQFFANLATGVGGQMGGTTTGTPAQPSPVGSIFGALGAIGSIMSDKRAKENIKPIGKTNDGQTIYRFNYKGDDVTQIGLLAQEVEKKHPEAVTTINGLKGVDYKEATDDAVRSMGGGVVPSSVRKDFAAGGPSISDEEDPMIPYKAGVPSKVLQIPKLARIGGNKPNFGGELPKQPGGGPSEKDFKGAAAGLGSIYNKLSTPSAAESGAKIVAGHEDFMDMLGGLSFALGGAASARRRRRFADGDEVPVTEDTIPVSEDKPIQVASLGDAARAIDAGVPSAEPIREPARNIEPGLLPSMARANADLPPMFSGREEAPAPQQIASAEPVAQPEAKPAGVVPSMARTDANVPAVSTGVAPAKAPAVAESSPILEMIRAEAERQGVPFEIAKQVAGAESRFNPNAQAKTSSAGGIYQIIDSTMRGLGGDPSQKYDPAQNIKYGIKYIAQNYNTLTSPDDPNAAAKVYMGHFFGTGGAKSILANPDRPISETLPNYRQAVASNAGIKSPSGVPIAEWTGRDAQEWAAAKMSGNYEPRGDGQRRVRVAEAGLGAGKTATDAGDRKWNFGMAGEGKRSIIESIMDRDFDPIQKRALFSFFAGMAASPSPWFGQQLGAGMQAASNVYNEAMNRQNELEIRRQQLGMEQQRIGISERLAGVQEKTKAIEALKFWQSRFRQIPTAEGFAYLDTTTGQTISQDEYNRQMTQVMKQYQLAPSEVGTAVPKPGLAPISAPATQQPEQAPAGGVVPQPKVEATTTPEPSAAPATATPSIPKPTEVPARTEAQAPKRPAEADMYADIRDDYNPIMLRDKAAEQRRIATNAQRLGDLAGAKAANDLADSYSKKAVDITENKVPVVFKDGTVGRIPQIEQESLRVESAKKAQEINTTENTKWMNDQADAQVRRDMLMSRTNELAKILENYETGRFNEEKANLVASLRAVGINVPNSATANPEKFEEFVKNQINNVFDEVKAIGGQVRVAEIQGLQQAQAGPGMQPEANRAILGYTRGVLNWENKKFDDSVSAINDQGINRFNRAQWMREWSKQNSLDNYIKEGKKSVAALGGTPDNPADLEEGQNYILKKGEYGAPKQGRYVYRGIQERDGKRGYVFEPAGGK